VSNANFDFSYKKGDEGMTIKAKGDIAEDMEIMQKAIELQGLVKKKLRKGE